MKPRLIHIRITKDLNERGLSLSALIDILIGKEHERRRSYNSTEIREEIIVVGNNTTFYAN